MATLEQKIIDELKLALEYQEPTGDYAQWLMGISLPSVIERKNDQLMITARVVVKTSDSEYVDGMDIAFSLEPIIDPNYYQNSPDYHRNTRGRFYCALFWLKNTEESVWKRFC